MEFAVVLVKPILTLIASQAFRDFLLKWNLDESLKRNLESYLNVIGAVLNYADDAQIDDPHIKAWLEDVKDALYDAEDLLGEILASNSAPGTQSGSSSKVRKSISKGIQFKIKDFIDTLNPFGKRIDDRMKSIVERLKTISDQKDILKLKETDGKKLSEIDGRLTAPLIDEDNRIYGRDQDRDKIINLLVQTEEGDNNRVSVIVIYGMGGLGKTTLAQIVYNDLKKRPQMEFSVQAWACVSDTFDVKKTTKDLLESATGKPSTVGDNKELLQDALMTELRGKRFLLVLDDIWTDDYRDWEALSVPFSVGGHGSKIIVTTRDAKVIKSIKHRVIPHELRTLDDDDCWSLFKEIAFPNGNSNGFPELEAIGKQIVRKCKGLPLAAKTIGGVLRKKEEDEKQWEDVLNSSVWGSRNEKYLPALILSYHHLPVEERQCFAYCSLFPKDYRFLMEELVLLWMAEGFVSSADGNGDLEAAGRRCFSNLLSMSFFQRYEYGYYGDSESFLTSVYFGSSRESEYVMHDLIHDLAEFISGKSYLRMDEGNEEVEEEKNTTSIKVRRFSFQQGEDDDFMEEDEETSNKVSRFSFSQRYDVSMKFKPIKCLRTFLPFTERFDYPSHRIISLIQLIPQMKFLRVLSLLRGYESVSELPDSVGDLKHLRYLDLSYTNISRLPDTINRLHNLQTLLLEKCFKLTRLPASMKGLVKLRHLKLDGRKPKHMPAGMEKMTQLRTLSYFFVGPNGPGIAVLKNLSHLQGRVHILGLRNVVKATDAIDANFQQKKYLNEVILDWGGVLPYLSDDIPYWRNESSSPGNLNVEEEFMRKLRFHTNLTKLTIRGYGGKKFPEWIKDLTKLVYLEITYCRYCESLPSSLGKLSCLKDLIIRDCESLGRIEDWGLDGLESLERFILDDIPSIESLEHLLLPKSITSLYLYDLPNLKTISNGLINLTSLRRLWIQDCVKLESLPEEGFPETLGKLGIWNCPLLKRRCEKGGADWSKIAHIPDFKILR